MAPSFRGLVKEILQDKTVTAEARVVIQDLVVRFEQRHKELLELRVQRRKAISEGAIDLLAETEHMRSTEWTVDAIPEALLERRVELMGGANRSEVINGMNAGAKSYIADLWNFTAHDTWSVMRAHKSLVGAADRTLMYLDNLEGRVRINPRSPTRLMVVPRPMYIFESAVQVDNGPVPAGIFDVAVFMMGCGNALVEKQGGIYLYLRDVQGHLEARLWVRIIEALEEQLELPRGTVRVTVMLDTIPGALEAEEILFELAHHAAGLSLDPQGYTADHVALFSGADAPILPDRETIGLNASFLRALSLRTIGICHKRGCHAIGAPSLTLPSRNTDRTKTEYLEMLADKEREAVDGHDGTIVVHEDMVNASMVEFNKSMPRAHQINFQREDNISPADLVVPPTGTITVDSVKGILRTALRSSITDNSKGWVIQGGRVHDRSSLLLALRLLWQWNHSNKGMITATSMALTVDLITFMLRKEADKMFEMTDPVLKKKVDAAMAYIVEQASSPSVPML